MKIGLEPETLQWAKEADQIPTNVAKEIIAAFEQTLKALAWAVEFIEQDDPVPRGLAEYRNAKEIVERLGDAVS